MPSLSLFYLTALSVAPVTVTMGDGTISGAEIVPYDHSWQQCTLTDSGWNNGSALIEKVDMIGEHVLRVAQTTSPQPGVTSNVAHYLDRATLAPIRSEMRFSGPDGVTLAERLWSFDATGYQAKISQGGQTMEKSGDLTNKMYNAITLGIPLSAIENWDSPVSMTGLMTQFDASYTLTATQVGGEIIRTADGNVAVRWIDVHWVHNGVGDVYPAGPDASGGRYWITEKSEAGLPRVLRYKTDTYAIEHLPRFCPAQEPQTDDAAE